jgi:hypothetical protein
MSVGRIFIIFFALILAVAAASIALVVAIVMSARASGGESDSIEVVAFFAGAFFATSFKGASTIVPALVLVVLGEAMRIRSFIYYGVAGAVVALASYFGSNISGRLENTTDIVPLNYPLQLAAAAGIIGGLIYWLIAGRNAGGARKPA